MSFLQNKRIFPYLLLIPSLLILALITLFPFLYNIWVSLHDYYLLYPKDMTFIGFMNYLSLLRNGDFWNSLKTSFLFTISTVGLEFIIGLLLALLLNRDFKGKNLFRTLFLFPMIVTPIAVGYMWRIMYSPSLGVINYFLSFIGITGKEWVADPKMALLSVVIVDVWQWTPFMALIFLAGLMSLPREPFEASIVDGSTQVQSFYYITLPLMKPVFIVALLFRFIDSFRTFDIIYSMTGGGPIRATETFNIHIYYNAFRDLQIGYSGALAIVFLFLVIVICTLILRWSKVEIID